MYYNEENSSFTYSIFFSTSVFAINEFKYLEKENPGQFCRDILQELDFSRFSKNQKEPFKLITELIVEDIDRVDGKRLEFDSYTLYMFIGKIRELLMF